MKENKFQADLKKELRAIFPGCIVTKLDSSDIQGIPDLLVLYKDKWAALEVKTTTFDNPYDPFEQFTLWYLFDTEKGYNTCGKLDRISNYSDDMTEKEVNDEHNRAIDELISFDFLNIYKKVPRNSKVALDLGAAPV